MQMIALHLRTTLCNRTVVVRRVRLVLVLGCVR